MSGQDVSCQNFNTVFVEYAQNLRYALTFKKKYDTLNLYEFFNLPILGLEKRRRFSLEKPMETMVLLSVCRHFGTLQPDSLRQ